MHAFIQRIPLTKCSKLSVYSKPHPTSSPPKPGGMHAKQNCVRQWTRLHSFSPRVKRLATWDYGLVQLSTACVLRTIFCYCNTCMFLVPKVSSLSLCVPLGVYYHCCLVPLSEYGYARADFNSPCVRDNITILPNPCGDGKTDLHGQQRVRSGGF